MISHRFLTHESIIQFIPPIDREQHLLFYTYLTQHKERAQFFGQFEGQRLTAVLAYLQGMSFPAFSFYCMNPGDVSLPELIAFTREAVQLETNASCGTILSSSDLQLFQSHGFITGTPKRFLTMKHVDESKLPEANRAEIVKEAEFAEVIDFFRKSEMQYFTRNELEHSPFLGIKEGGEFIAAGGFHFYNPQLVDLGNIVTRPDYRGKGLAKLLTRQLTYLGKQMSTDVYLDVFADNLPAVHVYESLGYQTVAELTMVNFTLTLPKVVRLG